MITGHFHNRRGHVATEIYSTATAHANIRPLSPEPEIEYTQMGCQHSDEMKILEPKIGV
jgi:hypothetical protein